VPAGLRRLTSVLLPEKFTDTTLSINGAVPGGSSFNIAGVNGLDKGSVNFSGSNTLVSRLSPAGTDIGGGSGSLLYSDGYYFNRSAEFTDTNYTVNGLNTVTVTLAPFASGLTAADYASGGANNDGVYDVLYFGTTGSATTAATASTDTVLFALANDMPAGLSVTQVATPSANGKVSFKLTAVPEPSTIVFAIGALGLLGINQRRRAARMKKMSSSR
jgi:hypothetical protein